MASISSSVVSGSGGERHGSEQVAASETGAPELIGQAGVDGATGLLAPRRSRAALRWGGADLDAIRCGLLSEPLARFDPLERLEQEGHGGRFRLVHAGGKSTARASAEQDERLRDRVPLPVGW